jgi:hypothetical protein
MLANMVTYICSQKGMYKGKNGSFNANIPKNIQGKGLSHLPLLTTI